MKGILSFSSLFLSFGTLICCALPALLVMLGFGATLAGFIGVFPEIVWFSENKGLVFSLAGIFITSSLWLQLRARSYDCSSDVCERTRSWSFHLLLLSATLYVIALFVAFLAPIIFL